MEPEARQFAVLILKAFNRGFYQSPSTWANNEVRPRGAGVAWALRGEWDKNRRTALIAAYRLGAASAAEAVLSAGGISEVLADKRFHSIRSMIPKIKKTIRATNSGIKFAKRIE